MTEEQKAAFINAQGALKFSVQCHGDIEVCEISRHDLIEMGPIKLHPGRAFARAALAERDGMKALLKKTLEQMGDKR